MTGMNRETRIEGSNTLVVTDRPNRKPWIIAAAVIAVAALFIALAMFWGSDEPAAPPAAGAAGAGGGRGGQVPSVTVVVPGQSQVARTVTASGALAARRDQPIGVAGEGGLVRAVLADAGSWVRQGQVLATIDRSVQTQTAAQLAASIQVTRADAALAQNEYDRSASLSTAVRVEGRSRPQGAARAHAANERVRLARRKWVAPRPDRRLDIAPLPRLIPWTAASKSGKLSAAGGGMFRLARGVR